MNITTRHGSEFTPTAVVQQVIIPTSYEDGESQAGDYTNFFIRDATESSVEYLVSTNAEIVTNLSPEVLDISEFPTVKWLDGAASGTGTLRFTTRGASVRRSFTFGPTGTVEDQSYTTSLIADTLLDLCHVAIIAAAAAANKDDEYFRLKTNQAPAAITSGSMYSTVEPNPDCWAAGWDFTGVPIWCSATNAPNHGGAPITARHFVEAEHYKSPVGTTWKWMLADGSIIERTSIGVNRRPSGESQSETYRLNEIPGDIRVHVLNAALPVGVKIYPIAGTWAQILKSTGNVQFDYPWRTSNSFQAPVAVVWLDRQRKAWFLGGYSDDATATSWSVAETTWEGTDISLPFSVSAFQYRRTEGALDAALEATGRFKNGVTGDSGSGLFIPLGGGDLALFTCFTTPTSGPYYSEDRLNVLIDSADADAIARGNLVSPTGLTVTVAPDPTL